MPWVDLCAVLTTGRERACVHACLRVHVCLCAPVSLCARVSMCARVCGGEAPARGSEPIGPGSLPLPPSSRPPTSVGLAGPFGRPLREVGVWRWPPCLPACSSGSRRGPQVGEWGGTPEEAGGFTLHTAQSTSSFFGEGCLGRPGALWAGSPPGLWGRPPSRGAAGVLEAPGAGGSHARPPSGELASPDAQDRTLLGPCWPPPALRTRHPRCGGDRWVKSVFFSGCRAAFVCPELHTRCPESGGPQESGVGGGWAPWGGITWPVVRGGSAGSSLPGFLGSKFSLGEGGRERDRDREMQTEKAGAGEKGGEHSFLLR